ncbi:DUF992 domain-containing protein [Rhizobiaceae bacterium n13]|uniref:DUF992 domain-containing protein n=1 Tax=Ferirhizobium litorale TaxID=2927786 RepID=A0AAE3QHI6_9HYPH|nr:DUF992 domain-containing protein [Fererhizobium litorale]MDI7864231.1 DUF992 domain-containing protein [Fererhizobium litorale]MDI7925126.1 DUF992 domain-containing protein [Fererhizobium litorale]
MRSILIGSALVLATIGGIGAASAEHAEVGQLDCDVSAGIGVIVGSKQDVSCEFKPSAPGPSVKYVGSITEFGLDIGTVKEGRLTWLVFNVTGKPVGGLAGTYRGVEADASLGLGGGAKVLVGGDRESVSLQPLSVEGEKGLNLAVGVAALRLREAN